VQVGIFRVKSRTTALVAYLVLAAVSCMRGALPSSTLPAAAAVALPEPETAATEGSDTATLTIEPDVPEPDVAEQEASAATPRSSIPTPYDAELAEAAQDDDAQAGPPGPNALGQAANSQVAAAHATKTAVAPPTFDAVFSEEDVQRWTEEESELAGPLALYSAVVLQRVRDYPTWRVKFDQQLEGRKQAGFAAQGVMRGVDDERVVAVWLAVTDVTHAKAFFAQAWRRLGVKARVKLSRNLAAEIPPDHEGLSAALVTLKLEELAYFRSAFDATAQARADAGLVGYSLGQDVDDEQIVYAYLQSEQPEALKAYLSSRETRRIWKDAGVLQIQSVVMIREGELMRCR
jgi:hypothetical protein